MTVEAARREQRSFDAALQLAERVIADAQPAVAVAVDPLLACATDMYILIMADATAEADMARLDACIAAVQDAAGENKGMRDRLSALKLLGSRYKRLAVKDLFPAIAAAQVALRVLVGAYSVRRPKGWRANDKYRNWVYTAINEDNPEQLRAVAQAVYQALQDEHTGIAATEASPFMLGLRATEQDEWVWRLWGRTVNGILPSARPQSLG